MKKVRPESKIHKVKPVLSSHSKRRHKLAFKINYRLMQVMLQGEHSAILSTFIKLPFVNDIFYWVAA